MHMLADELDEGAKPMHRLQWRQEFTSTRCHHEVHAHHHRILLEGLFITKVGVTVDIPLCDSSTTLMTLHLLYDYYIQLLTLNLHLT